MATPPFDIAQTTPQDNDIISQFPGTERTFRDVVESWLTLLSDPTTGLLKPTAVSLPLTLSHAATGAILTLISTDAGALAGPGLFLKRDSASQADNDILGYLGFYGEDSAGNETSYGFIIARADDVTNGTEDGSILIQPIVAGTNVNVGIFNGTGLAVTGSVIASSSVSGTTGVFSPGASGLGVQVRSNAAGVGPAYVAFQDSDGSPRLGYVGSGSATTTINLVADLGDIAILASAGDITLTAGGGNITLNDATNVVGTFSASAGISGTTGNFSSTLTAASTIHSAVGIFEGGDTTNVISATGAGTIFLRPNGTGVTTGQMTVGPTGLVTVNGDLTATGDISGSTGDFSSNLTVTGHILAEGTVMRGSATQLVLGTLGPTGDTGTIFLRPQGYNSAVSQVTISGSTGNMAVNGNITSVADGIHTANKTASNPATVGVSLTAAGQVVATKVADTCLILNRTSTDGVITHFRNDNVTVGSIDVNAATTDYNTSSDERLKENFREFDGGEIIDAINVYHFDWKVGGTGYGVKAQECIHVFPDAISTGDGEWGTENFVPWGADYSKFVPLLLAEVKALRARMITLETKEK